VRYASIRKCHTDAIKDAQLLSLRTLALFTVNQRDLRSIAWCEVTKQSHLPGFELLTEGVKMIKSNQLDTADVGILPAVVLTSAFLKGAEIWINAHGEVLSAMEAAMANWMTRRREAFDSWSRSLKRMCECRDPIDFVQTQQDWLCDAVRLTASDIRALADDTAILTRKPTAGVDKTVSSQADDILKTRRGRPDTDGSQREERVAAE
jgi:hypothetical protein